MSRHKLVKNLDLEDELDDYDGGEDYDDETAEQMREGTLKVRDALPASTVGSITDAQIQDALWHYYYDIDKSVAYLLKSSSAPKAQKKEKKAQGGSFLFGFDYSRGRFGKRQAWQADSYYALPLGGAF